MAAIEAAGDVSDLLRQFENLHDRVRTLQDHMGTLPQPHQANSREEKNGAATGSSQQHDEDSSAITPLDELPSHARGYPASGLLQKESASSDGIVAVNGSGPAATSESNVSCNEWERLSVPATMSGAVSNGFVGHVSRQLEQKVQLLEREKEVLERELRQRRTVEELVRQFEVTMKQDTEERQALAVKLSEIEQTVDHFKLFQTQQQEEILQTIQQFHQLQQPPPPQFRSINGASGLVGASGGGGDLSALALRLEKRMEELGESMERQASAMRVAVEREAARREVHRRVSNAAVATPKTKRKASVAAAAEDEEEQATALTKGSEWKHLFKASQLELSISPGIGVSGEEQEPEEVAGAGCGCFGAKKKEEVRGWFRILCRHGPSQWTVHRAASEFVFLHLHLKEQAMRRKINMEVHHFPKRYFIASSTEKQKKALCSSLEGYLKQLARMPEVGVHYIFLQFLQVSAATLQRGFEPCRYEGPVVKSTGSAVTHGGCFSCSFSFHRWRERKRQNQRWFVLKDSCLFYMQSPLFFRPMGVMLFDRDAKLSPDPRNLQGPQGGLFQKRFHKIQFSNGGRDVTLHFKTTNQARRWLLAIDKAMRGSPYCCVDNKYSSYAPPRPKCTFQWYLNGCAYFHAVAEALDEARKEIYIAGWYLSPHIYLRRPSRENDHWRLDKLLQRKAAQGVQIYVLIFRELEVCIEANNSHFAKQVLRGLHSNIHVLRSPNDIAITYHSHHEKLVITDAGAGCAFVGGIDLAFGRWDTSAYQLADAKEVLLWPGKDYCNDCYCPLRGTDLPFLDHMDRGSEPRMPWHDFAVKVCGDAAFDVARHFLGRWNKRTHNERDGQYPQLIPELPMTADDLIEAGGRFLGGGSAAEARSSAEIFPRRSGAGTRKFSVRQQRERGLGGDGAPGGAAAPWDRRPSAMPRNSFGGGFGGSRKNLLLVSNSDSRRHLFLTKQESRRHLVPPDAVSATHAEAAEAAGAGREFPSKRAFDVGPQDAAVSGSHFGAGPEAAGSEAEGEGRLAMAAGAGFGSDEEEGSAARFDLRAWPAGGEGRAADREASGLSDDGSLRRGRKCVEFELEAGAPPAQGEALREDKDRGRSMVPPALRRALGGRIAGDSPRTHSTSPILALTEDPAAPACSSPRPARLARSPVGAARPFPPPPPQSSTPPSTRSLASSDMWGPGAARKAETSAPQPTEGSGPESPLPRRPGHRLHDPIRLPDSEFASITAMSRLGSGSASTAGGSTAGDLLSVNTAMRRLSAMTSQHGGSQRSFAGFIQPPLGASSFRRRASSNNVGDIRNALLQDTGPEEQCTCQVLRSIDKWSGDLVNEKSIEEAYVRLIRSAKHYVHIENQFFVSACEVGVGEVENRVAKAILDRITQEISDERRLNTSSQFRVVILMPMLPGLPGSPQVNASKRMLLHLQYETICRGGHSLIQKLREVTDTPEKYIGFYGLRQWGRMPDGIIRHEQIYIHGKLMIVDDRHILCGSANINDRSLLGKNDSEVVLLASDSEQRVASQMFGKPWEAFRAAREMRMRLYQIHLGSSATNLNLEDPCSPQMLRCWDEVARSNSVVYREVFRCFPDDEVKTWETYELWEDEQERLLDEQTEDGGLSVEERLQTVTGHLCQFPLRFLEEEDLCPTWTEKEYHVDRRVFT